MDVPLGRHEDEDVALIDAGDLRDGRQHRLLQVGLVPLFVGQWRPPADFDRIRPPGNFDHRRRAVRRGEMGGEPGGVDRGRRDDQLQIAPLRQQPLQISDEKINVQRPLVGFIQNDRVVLVQECVALGFGQQDAVGHQFDVRLRRKGLGEADLEADVRGETQSDAFLDQYDTIILDEAHERSLNIDFLIGYLKRLLPKRRDLKLIVTSATIDAARFAAHFATPHGPAPVVEVSGRTYPVEVRWRPPLADEEGDEPDLQQAVLAAVAEVAGIDQGDILIFMPTERHIHETVKSLRGRPLPGDRSGRLPEILPLYGRLSMREQQRVFQPGGKRRVVIATNVAESSLTVPRIRYVIDPGTARISRYSPRSKTQRLPIEPISRASADQRKGRCGRIGPGICVRLFGEEDYAACDAYTPPEIQRSNLATVILQTKALRLGPIERFPFLDPPKPEAVNDGYRTLVELGAIDAKGELTEVGRQLSRLPIDPRFGRMILAAADEGCLHEVLIIAAALAVQDPRERPLDKQEAADASHTLRADEQSDFVAYLKLWDFYHKLKSELSRGQLRKACRQNFLSFNRMREWLDVHRELMELVRQSGLLSPFGRGTAGLPSPFGRGAGGEGIARRRRPSP